MAPAPPERLHDVLARLRKHARRLEVAPFKFGSPHYSHAVLQQEGVFRVRGLAVTPEQGRAYLEKHGHFMPEDAAMISEPTGPVVLEAPTLEGLIALLEAWPSLERCGVRRP